MRSFPGRSRGLFRAVLVLCALLSGTVLGPLALAQPSQPTASAPALPAAPRSAAPADEDGEASLPPDVAPDSPRASMKRYLDLCRAGEYADAADYLDLPEGMKAEGPALARKLKAVLDRQIWVKLDALSPASLGMASDMLPPGVDEIGTVPGRSGMEPVRLTRRRGPDGMRWIFSRSTVERIPDWYGRLSDRFLQDYLPEALLRPGPHELVWWQWIALPFIFLASLGVGHLLGYITRRLLAPFVRRGDGQRDESFHSRFSGPFALSWALVAVYLAFPVLGLYPPAEAFMERVLRAGFFLAVFWFALRSVDVASARALALPGAKGNPAALSLVPLGAKIAKIAVIAMAVIAVLSELGYPVTSLIAGLGISGVALALAAQKTVENLFGSIAIGIDQPFRVGDFITVENVTGTVESIGLRSTRVRTLDRTLVTIPNGKLADLRVESFAERDRLRFLCVLGLSRDARADVVRQVLEGARGLLGKHPKIWPDLSVSLIRITDVSLDVEISAWFSTTDSAEFLRLREQMLLDLLDIVERAGAELAYPTRRVLMREAEDGLPTSW